MGDTLKFDQATYEEFKRLYTHANDTKREIFIFQGKEVLVAYAKYLLEYLEMQGFRSEP